MMTELESFFGCLKGKMMVELVVDPKYRRVECNFESGE